MSDAWQTAHEANVRSRTEFKRPVADIHADFESGIPLSMDGERKRTPAADACAHAMYQPDCARCEADRIKCATNGPAAVLTGFVPIDPGLWIRSVDGSWRAAPEDSILLTGAQAEQYKRLMAAAAEAAVITARMKSTSEALRDAFAQFCAGVSQGEQR